jgi:alcohol dehydrogenase class IV
MEFEFATAARIVFGPGRLKELPGLAAMLGENALIVTGRSTDRAETLADLLTQQNISCCLFNITEEPTTQVVIEGANLAKGNNCDLVIALGGGSAVDAGKAIAALITNEGDLFDYLEVIGAGKAIKEKPVPLIAVPTTAGTGSEVTKNAVLKDQEKKVKVSMRHPMMIPDIALIDPELTYTLPPNLTASTGLDALTQLMEAFVSNKASPLTDGICREGLLRAGRSLKIAYDQGESAEAREDMAVASLFGGLALANAGLGAVHGFAGSLGGMFTAPHGIICARLLPHVMKANIEALTDRDPHSPNLRKYAEVSRLLTGQASASAEDGIKWTQELCDNLAVAPLGEFGLRREHFDTAINKAKKASSMKGNPVELSGDELDEILEGGL